MCYLYQTNKGKKVPPRKKDQATKQPSKMKQVEHIPTANEGVSRLVEFYKNHKVHSVTIDNTARPPIYIIEYEAGPDSKEFQAIAKFIDLAIGGMECFIDYDLAEAEQAIRSMNKIKGFPLRIPGSGWNNEATYDTKTKEEIMTMEADLREKITSLVNLSYHAKKEDRMITGQQLEEIRPYANEMKRLLTQAEAEELRRKKKSGAFDPEVIKMGADASEAYDTTVTYIENNL